MSEITAVESFIAGAWKEQPTDAIDDLISASKYAVAIGNLDDADDMLFCAGLAIEMNRPE